MIPKKLHFITGLKSDFGGKPFGFVHYMAIKSAMELNQGFQVYIYYKYEPSGPYWDLIRSRVTEVVVEPPESIFGNRIEHFAHKADILRLEILIREGGVYLDMDTICNQPFETVFNGKVVMGIEGFQLGYDRWNAGDRLGLCNALIITPAGAEFLTAFIHEGVSFNSSTISYAT